MALWAHGSGELQARYNVGSEDVYRPDDREASFFRDMNSARHGDFAASERLGRNNQISAREVRAGDLTYVGATAGETFAPPLWMTSDTTAVTASVASTGFGVAVVQGGAFNALGVRGEPTAEGASGSLLNLPVYVDNNIPQNLGAGTNEDRVFVCRCDDVYLWETDLSLQVFDSTYANQMSLLVRASSFSSLIPDRFGASVNVLQGTGMIVPTL